MPTPESGMPQAQSTSVRLVGEVRVFADGDPRQVHHVEVTVEKRLGFDTRLARIVKNVQRVLILVLGVYPVPRKAAAQAV